MYGLSEAGVATYNDPSSVQGSKQGTAGLEVPGYMVGIFDNHEPVKKAGDSGEICIKSEGVIQSYWRRPDADEAAFFGRPNSGLSVTALTRFCPFGVQQIGFSCSLAPDGNSCGNLSCKWAAQLS